MAYVRWSVSYFASVVFSVRRMGSFAGPLKAIVELSRNLVRLRTGEEGSSQESALRLIPNLDLHFNFHLLSLFITSPYLFERSS